MQASQHDIPPPVPTTPHEHGLCVNAADMAAHIAAAPDDRFNPSGVGAKLEGVSKQPVTEEEALAAREAQQAKMIEGEHTAAEHIAGAECDDGACRSIQCVRRLSLTAVRCSQEPC